MVDPNKPHGYRRRRVTAEKGGCVRMYCSCPQHAHHVTERERPCDVCGGSRELAIHLPKRTRRNTPAWSDFRPGPYAFAREIPRG